MNTTTTQPPQPPQQPPNIKRLIPHPATSLDNIQPLLAQTEADTDILRQARIGLQFSNTLELTFYQMYPLTKQLIGTYSYTPPTNTTTPIPNIIAAHILAKINTLVIKSQYVQSYHPFEFYKLRNINIIEYTTTQKLTMTLNIYRPNKMHGFVFYFDINIRPNQFTINIAELIGLPLVSDKGYGTGMLTGLDKYSQIPYSKYTLEPPPTPTPPLSIEDQNAELKSRHLANATAEQQKKAKCFAFINGENTILRDFDNELFCEAYHPDINQVGIWDTPCQLNTDCPFYQSNKNYPNQFGGCNQQTGYCQLPVGLKPLGFKHHSKTTQPMCYNCPTNTRNNNCCVEQQKLYTSPDYMFIGDNNLRLQNKSILNSQNLKDNPAI